MELERYSPRLVQLQREALEAEIPRSGTTWLPDLAYLESVASFVRARGFEPAGVGSSRIAIRLDPPDEEPLVAKLAWEVRGLGCNLAEAATWLALDADSRRFLAPCVCIARTLILVQRYAQPIVPPRSSGTERHEALAELHAKGLEWQERISEVHEGLGGEEKRDHLRLDNYGLVDGTLRVLDYGSGLRRGNEGGGVAKQAGAWIYRRTRARPVCLDEPTRERFRVDVMRDGKRLLRRRERIGDQALAVAAGWQRSPVPCPVPGCDVALPCELHPPLTAGTDSPQQGKEVSNGRLLLEPEYPQAATRAA